MASLPNAPKIRDLGHRPDGYRCLTIPTNEPLLKRHPQRKLVAVESKFEGYRGKREYDRASAQNAGVVCGRERCRVPRYAVRCRDDRGEHTTIARDSALIAGRRC